MTRGNSPAALRTLFMTAAIGSGHHQAQRAVSLALKARGVQVQEELLETTDYMNRVERGVGVDLYALALRHAPWLYRSFYDSTDRGGLWNHGIEFLFRQGQGRFQPELMQFDPQVVVSSFWAPCAVAGRIRQHQGMNFLNALVVTDYRTHFHWARPEADLLLVAAEETRAQMIGRGIPPERVVVTGIPIAPVFKTLLNADRAGLKEKLNLRPEWPLILLSAGGTGVYRSLKPVLGELGLLGKRAQVVIPGACSEARTETVGGTVFHHVPFTPDFPVLLAASEVVVGKAGGLTVAESTALGVPMIVFDPIPGQEEHNADFLARAGAGFYVKSLSGVRAAVLQALDADEHARLSAAACAVGHVDAADRVAQAILQRLEATT